MKDYKKNIKYHATYNLNDEYMKHVKKDLEIINYIISEGTYDWNYGLHGACFGGHIDVAQK